MKEEWYEKVIALAKEGKGDDAERMVEEKIGIIPKTAQDYFDRGMAFWSKRNLEAALVDFQECVKLVPEDYEANLRLGYILSNLDRDEEALRVFEKVIELKPDDPEGYRSRANTLFGLKRFEEELEYLEFLESKFPDSKDFWRLFGSGVLNELGRNAQALEALKGIDPSRINPLPSYVYYLHLSGTLCMTGRFDEAFDALDEGMDKTRMEEGCISCFVGNCWRSPYLEPLRKSPYRERFEAVVGPQPSSRKKASSSRE